MPKTTKHSKSWKYKIIVTPDKKIITRSVKIKKKKNPKRKVSEATKRLVAGRQYFRCAVKPGTEISKKLHEKYGYECPNWVNSEKKGSFGPEGYEIDHIEEWSISHNDGIENLQALCPSCHRLKTRVFMIEKSVKKQLFPEVINLCDDDDVIDLTDE